MHRSVCRSVFLSPDLMRNHANDIRITYTFYAMKGFLTILGVIAISMTLNAQSSEKPAEQTLSSMIKFNGYIDSYYATDNDARAGANRLATNPLNIAKDRFALNSVQMTAQADAESYHAKITLQYGDIAQNDWISTGEDPLTPSSRIQEAYAGLRLSDGLWVDAGYFLTHIGGESILPRDNWLQSVSLCTQFEPIFQSGVRVSWDASSDLNICLHALNGYNRFSDNNEQKSLGYSIGYKLSNSSTIALNGIAGNEQPTGTAALTRIYNNLVFNTSLSDAWSLKVVADAGTQKVSADEASMSLAYGAFASLRYAITTRWAATVRAEMFSDKDGIVSGSNKLCAQAGTIGVEYRPVSNAYVRCESRYMRDSNTTALFESSDGMASHSRLEGIFSVGVSFN